MESDLNMGSKNRILTHGDGKKMIYGLRLNRMIGKRVLHCGWYGTSTLESGEAPEDDRTIEWSGP